MEQIFKALLYVHVAFGTISLIVFWIPTLSKKGGQLHIKAGKIYVICMWVVVISALILSILDVFRERYFMAGLLGYLSFLTALPLWYAIQVLKQKKEVSRKYFRNRRYFGIVVFILALIMILWSLYLGVKNEAILLLIFGIIGLTSFKEVRQSFEEVSKSPWIIVHLQGMLISAIAAYTAFFAFGGNSVLGFIFKNQLQVIPWVLPSIIGTIAINIMTKKYTKQTST